MTAACRHAVLGLWLCLLACGDDDGMAMTAPDSGADVGVSRIDAGSAPTCGVSTCGSPLVGDVCCTRREDISSGVASAVDRCGVDLSAMMPALLGDCVELRQPGDLDDRCPARLVGSALEPGCCMPSGFCGSLNQTVDLGCQRVLGGSEPLIACGPSMLDAGDSADAR